MTILILLALCVLAAIFAVCFGVFKLGWLLFKSHSNKGPLITAGVCTVLLAGTITLGTWLGVRAVLAPFQGMMARVKQNPAPVYGEHVYQDHTFPFALTVYDGMDFSDWIHLGGVDLKFGMDTNALKKDSTGKRTDNFLIAALVRQPNVTEKQPFEVLKTQLNQAQAQRQLTLTQAGPANINGLPAYQATGEAYTNRGKVNFWLSAVQPTPDTLYYIGVLALQDTPQLAQQAQGMLHSFRLTNR